MHRIADKQKIVTDKTSRTPAGFLQADVSFARSGVQVYSRAYLGLDGDPAEPVVVFRPPEEVFDEESMASFSNVPVTLRHPPGGYLDEDNASEHTKGLTGAVVTRDGNHLTGTVVIFDGELIRMIEAGDVREVSNGYVADFEMTPGSVPGTGEKYDAIQRNIRGNHMAFVRRGRCGPTCAIMNDDDCDGLCGDTSECQEGNMSKRSIVVDDISYEFEDSACQVIEKLQRKCADNVANLKSAGEKTEEENEELKKENAKQKKNVDELRAEVDDLKKSVSDARDTSVIDARVTERAAILDKARRVCPDIEVVDGDGNSKANIDIMKEVLTERNSGDATINDESDDYVRAAFDFATKGGDESSNFHRRNPATDTRRSGDSSTRLQAVGDEAYEASNDSRSEAWKGRTGTDDE